MGRTGRSRGRRYRSTSENSQECSDDVKSMNRLVEWLQERGWSSEQSTVLTPAMFQTSSNEGPRIRGLLASQSVAPGDVLISVPLRTLLTSSTALESCVGHLLKSLAPVSGQLCLTLLLVHELGMGAASQWAPYLRTLPRSYSTPLYLHRAEVNSQYLPPLLLDDVIKCRNEVLRQYRRVCSAEKSKNWPINSRLLFDKFLYAWSTVDTRSVYLDGAAKRWPNLVVDDTCALAPFVDLLNHDNSASTCVRLGADCYSLVTESRVHSGQQAFISYGCLDSRQLLLRYGFVPEPGDVESVPASLSHLPVTAAVRCRAVELGLSDMFTVLPAVVEWQPHALARIDHLSWTLAACCWLAACPHRQSPWRLTTRQLLTPVASHLVYARLLARLWREVDTCCRSARSRIRSGSGSACLVQCLKLYDLWRRILSQFVTPEPNYSGKQAGATLNVSIVLAEDWPAVSVTIGYIDH